MIKNSKSRAHALLDWYDENARILPWRISPDDRAKGVMPDPYAVWLSEIMLQQTTVATVKDYFVKFLGLWPNIHELASAPLDDILKAWAGLGYYSRARNLHKCAQILASEHDGQFPTNAAQLEKLPGIGPYTSAAIAAISFDEKVAVIDGNVERVFSRLHRIQTPLPLAKAPIKEKVARELPNERSGDFAQAVMDLGATICTPKNAKCSLCPFEVNCAANQHDDIETYPIKPPKKQKPTRRGAAFILTNQRDEIWVEKRPDTGLLAKMTQVPTTNWNSNKDGAIDVKAAPVAANWQHKGQIKHTFTHFHLFLEIYCAKWEAETPPVQAPEETSSESADKKGWWLEKNSIQQAAFPALMHKVLKVGFAQ